MNFTLTTHLRSGNVYYWAFSTMTTFCLNSIGQLCVNSSWTCFLIKNTFSAALFYRLFFGMVILLTTSGITYFVFFFNFFCFYRTNLSFWIVPMWFELDQTALFAWRTIFWFIDKLYTLKGDGTGTTELLAFIVEGVLGLNLIDLKRKEQVIRLCLPRNNHISSSRQLLDLHSKAVSVYKRALKWVF